MCVCVLFFSSMFLFIAPLSLYNIHQSDKRGTCSVLQEVGMVTWRTEHPCRSADIKSAWCLVSYYPAAAHFGEQNIILEFFLAVVRSCCAFLPDGCSPLYCFPSFCCCCACWWLVRHEAHTGTHHWMMDLFSVAFNAYIYFKINFTKAYTG